ncbi:MAG: hypothetical protein KY475_04885 [Planctomycetes bacterium]|nr:hypothetical protein [Planctomycetota bacterium]
MIRSRSRDVSRRQFLASAAAGTAALAAAPAAHTAAAAEKELIVGEGEHRYRVHDQWVKPPAPFSWQTTHNVAVDRDCNLYVIHEGRADQTDHPSIFVFDSDGRHVRSFGAQFQGGGHGIEVRDEAGEQFLYVCAYQQVKSFAKLTLDGEIVWQKFALMKAGVYSDGEAAMPKKVWGRDRFMPTNFAFLDDGVFLLADGYGSYLIHRYDKEGEYLSSFGGPGEGNGTFNTPHGLWIDRRPGREPAVVVTDRAHHTVQYLSLAHEHRETLSGFGLPANADTWKDLMVIPELLGRVTLLDIKNQVAAHLGDDSGRIQTDNRRRIRGDESQWRPGRFVHPHDACFDPDGNIYVAEWVATGRITKLERLT